MNTTTTGTPAGRDGLLDIKQVAARLAMSVRSVRTLVSLGQLPAIHILRAVRYHPDDVEAFIQSRRSKPRTSRYKPTAAPVAPPSLDGGAS